MKYFRWMIKEVPDKTKNPIEIKKNEIIRKVAKNAKVQLIDFESYLGSTKFKRFDHIHFEKKTLEMFVNYIFNKAI